MPFIGNQPALSYTSFAKQDFTTSATTTYTLDNPVANANELALFINFVRQEPTTAYSASGTTLTLTSATSSSDDMYCVYLGKAVQTVNPPNASVGASQIVDASITSGKLASGVLPVNTPMFFVNKNSTNTTVAEGTNVKVTDFDEIYDTNNAFASNKFTPGVAGHYYMEGTTSINIANAGSYLQAMIYKNGSMISYQQVVAEGTNATYSVTANVIDLANTTDYYELYIRHNTGGNSSINYSSTGRYTRFLGHKLIT